MMEDKAAIATALRDPDASARCRFMESLEAGEIGPDSLQLIIKLTKEDPSIQVRLAGIRKCAAFWPDPHIIKLFRALAVDPEIQVADGAVGALGRAHDSRAREVLLEAYLKSPHFGYKWLVFEALTAHWAFAEIESIIVGYMLADSDEVIRASTVSYLSKQHDANLIADLIQLLTDSDARVRANALEALGHFKKVVDRTIFEGMLVDPHHRVQSAAMVILDEVGGLALDGQLETMAHHRDELVRASAVYVLRQRQEFANRREVLEELAEDNSPVVQRQLALLPH
jgi:HEAT repeat protein